MQELHVVALTDWPEPIILLQQKRLKLTIYNRVGKFTKILYYKC